MDAESFYRRPLPGGFAAFASPEGRRLFAEALAEGNLEGYFGLAEQFHTQSEPAFCGLGTLVMTLNALGIDPGRLWKGPWRWYSEEMLDCCAPLEVVRQGGITLDQFACLARCNGASAEVRRAGSGDLDAFREQVRAAARSAGEPVVAVAYTRRALGQTGDGHFSPLAGYHAASDRALLLDVARFKYPPHWVPLPLLWESMQALDPSTGRARGYVVLRRSAAPAALYFRLSLGRCSWDELSRQLFEALPSAIEAARPPTAAEAVRLLAGLMPASCAAGASSFGEALGALAPEHRAQVDALREALQHTALFGLVRDASGIACCGEAPEALTALLLAVAPWLAPSMPPGTRAEFEALWRPSALPPLLAAEAERLREQIAALRLGASPGAPAA